MKKVKAVVQYEFDKVQLANQVSEDQGIDFSSCDYDYKLKAMRCPVSYRKYYVAKEQPFDELMRVDKYLISLGWNRDSRLFSQDEKTRLTKIGYMPFAIYKKTEPYQLELIVHFFDEHDDGYYKQKQIELLDQYSDQYTTFYYIVINSDIVR